MNKKVILCILLALSAGLMAGYLVGSKKIETDKKNKIISFDPLNTTYTIDEQPIALSDGKVEIGVAAGSAMKDIVEVFGQPTLGDFDNDGDTDAAVVLVESPGGTGTFYYVAAAMNEVNGSKGTNAIFIGDRIAPQTLEFRKGKIIMNYADRKPNEPMAVAPSVGVSKYFVVAQGILRETDGL